MRDSVSQGEPLPASGASLCGDGRVDVARGEECDGQACCSSDCRLLPAGTECDDGSGETIEDRCTSEGDCRGRRCGNGRCDLFERWANSCPADCEAPASPCNQDGVCGAGENDQNCPEDCRRTTCGNAVCEAGESISTCVYDCTPGCNYNGVCDGGEDYDTCPWDCPEAPQPAQVMTSAGPCGVWARKDASDVDADGSLEKPFKWLEPALEKARSEGKILCVMEGEYYLNRQSLQVRDKDKIFGSFRVFEDGRVGRAEDFATTRRTVIGNDGNSPVLRIETDAGEETEVNGLAFRQEAYNLHVGTAPVVSIGGGKAKFRHNTVVSLPVDTYASNALLRRIGIEVTSGNGEGRYGPLLESNAIHVGDLAVDYGAAIGILVLQDNANGELAVELSRNRIEAGKASMLSVGVLGFATEPGFPLTAKLSDNVVRFSEAKQPVYFRSSDNAYTPGGHSAGIVFGESLKNYSAMVQQEPGNWSVFQKRHFSQVQLLRNEVLGHADSPSYISSAVRLTGGSSAEGSVLANNILVAGTGQLNSSALHLDHPGALKVEHNTLVGGGVSLPRVVLEDRGAHFAWESRYIARPTHARSCSVYSIDPAGAKVPLLANIFSSRIGTGDKYALCVFNDPPFTSVSHNLFDSKLDYAYFRGSSTEGSAEWNFSEFLLGYPLLSLSGGGTPALSGNLSENPGFRDFSADLFELSAGSQAIDVAPCGTEEAWAGTDLQGQARPEGERCDIGADEYVQP